MLTRRSFLSRLTGTLAGVVGGVWVCKAKASTPLRPVMYQGVVTEAWSDGAVWWKPIGPCKYAAGLAYEVNGRIPPIGTRILVWHEGRTGNYGRFQYTPPTRIVAKSGDPNREPVRLKSMADIPPGSYLSGVVAPWTAEGPLA